MRVKSLLSALAAILILSGCMLPREEELLPPDLLRPEEVKFITIEVETGSIQDILEDHVIASSSVLYEMTFNNRSGFLAELAVRTGEAVSAGDVLARLDTGSLEIDIERQKLEIEKIKVTQEEIRVFGGSRFERRRAELNLEMAELLLTQLENEFANSSIVAPVDGEVVFLNTFRIGEFVAGRSVVLTIADPSHLQFEYSGAQTGRIRYGMDVEVSVGANIIPATVTMTPATAPAEDRDRFRNTVIITAKNQDDIPGGIRIGSFHNFNIHIEEKSDVIIIPSGSISNFMGQSFVQILEAGMRMERDIDIGIVTRLYTEVLSGLEEGELLIVGVER